MEYTKVTNIRFPVDLINELDKELGKGERSQFIIEATRKELIKRKQARSLQKVKGIIKADEYPEFKDAENVYHWVRESRQGSDKKRGKLIRE